MYAGEVVEDGLAEALLATQTPLYVGAAERGAAALSNSSRQTQRCLSFPNQDSMNAWLSGSR